MAGEKRSREASPGRELSQKARASIGRASPRRMNTARAAVIAEINILARDLVSPIRPPRRRAAAAVEEIAAAAPPAAAEPQRREKPKEKKRKKKKTVSMKGRRAVVINVMASIEARKMSAGPTAAPSAAAAAQPAAPPVAEDHESSPSISPEDIRNLGKAWSKAELTKLARIGEDQDYLAEIIPDHSGPGLDWECISRHFGRYSKGGNAAKAQYNSVLRMMKEARREGRKGSNYVDLIQKALSELPDSHGTIFDIHKVLKAKYASHLDKYKVNGSVQWKKAVREVLNEEKSKFGTAGKTATGSKVYFLRNT